MTPITKKKETLLTLSRNFLDGKLSKESFLQSVKGLEAPKEHYDVDGLTLEGEEDNSLVTLRSILSFEDFMKVTEALTKKS